MKKALITIVVLCLLAIMLVGCGSFSPPIILPDPPLPQDPNNPEDPDVGDGEEHEYFNVYLVDESGDKFYPPQQIYAQWTGEEGVHSALFDDEGHARVADLDGEYRVTLSSLPTNYTYDPNNNIVSNEQKDITIEVKHIIANYNSSMQVQQNGDFARNIRITQLGTYRVTLTSKNDSILFYYIPKGGIYSIESWVNITENLINPIVKYYEGSNFAYKNEFGIQAYDDGGSCTTFTKNFRFVCTLTVNEEGGSFIFEIQADSIGNNYPVTFDFTVKQEGDPPKEDIDYVKVKPAGPYNTGSHRDDPIGSFHYVYGINRVLDDKYVKYNEDDGYYHFYDPASDTMYGVLYAKINKDCEILTTEKGNGFLSNDISLRFNGKDYYDFIATYDYYCNADGAHPVNEELKQFLFDYASLQRFFNDGNGWAELLGFNSGESDQWLFCCGFYA